MRTVRHVLVLLFASTHVWASPTRADGDRDVPNGSAAGTEEPSVEILRRELPTWVVGAELGWNALAGWGIQASWRPRSHPVAVDAAGGLSLNGVKGGLRARWIGEDPLRAQTLGVGVQVAGGGGWDVPDDPPPVPLWFSAGLFAPPETHVVVGPTAYLQAVWGVQLRSVDGTDVTVLVGWSQVVAGHALRSEAPLTAAQRGWVDSLTGSGLVLSLSLGFGGG